MKQSLRLANSITTLTLLVLSAYALAQEAPTATPQQSLATENHIAPPKQRYFRMPHYPDNERIALRTGYVDVAMVVSAEGQMLEVKSVTSEPNNVAFEETTKAAVQTWLFVPGLKRCVPTQSEVTYRVSFNLTDGNDRVQAVPLLSKSQTLDSLREMIAPNKNEMLRKLKYPVAARLAGAQGSVYLMLKVNQANGNIESVDIASASSNKAGFERNFSDAAIEVVRRFVFTPMPELKDPGVICVPFVFALM